MKTKWENHQYGYGQSIQLALGIKITVDKESFAKGSLYKFYFNGIASKSSFEDRERAKIVAVNTVQKILEKALNNLNGSIDK